MKDATRNAAVPPEVAAWLRQQKPAVRKAILASVDFVTDTVRDAGLGEPSSGAVDCLRRLAALEVALPSAECFKIALDLLDKAGVLALEIGVVHYRTEIQLRAFLSLAGTALFADTAAIERFERGFSLDSPIDDVISYFQAELEAFGGFPGE